MELQKSFKNQSLRRSHARVFSLHFHPYPIVCNAFPSFAFLVGPTCVCSIAIYQRDGSCKRRGRKLRLAAFGLLFFGYKYRAAGLSRFPNWNIMWGGPISKPSHSTSTTSSHCSANNSAPKSQASKIASCAKPRKSKPTRPTGSSA